MEPLCIDIGNTNVVAAGSGVFERTESDPSLSAYHYSGWLRDRVFSRAEFGGCIISSVVPRLTSLLSDAVAVIMGRAPLVLRWDTKTGIKIKIDDPSELGADLLATAVGAAEKYPLPALIIDMGTATKFTVVNREREFLGGAFLPGIKTSYEQLLRKAALLRDFKYGAPASVMGANTPDSLNAGAVYGSAAMVDGMCRRYEQYLGERPTAVITGGIAGLVAPYCETPLIYDETLLVDGLAAIYKMNRSEK